MPVPTKEKTWQHLVNRAVGGTGDGKLDNRSYLLSLKNALKGFGLNPWTVWGSRSWNGSTGSLDGSGGGNDYWTNTSMMVFNGAGSNHAWIVLTQPALSPSGKFSVCLDLTYLPYGDTAFYIVVSPNNGFGVINGGTDGTGTNRPTATDQYVYAEAGYGLLSGTWQAKGLHVMQSTDGKCTRAVLCRGGGIEAFWIFDEVKNPCAAWTLPRVHRVLGYDGTTDKATSYANFNDAAGLNGAIGSVNGSYYLTSEGYGGATLGENITYVDDDSGELPISPMWLVSSSFGVRGSRKASMYDLWWGSTAVANGDCYPADGSRSFAQFGHMIFPWDGSAPLTG